MFAEFNYEGRSSMKYVMMGRRHAVFHMATLMATGFWDSSNQEHAVVLDRLSTAMEVYKYREVNTAWYDPSKCGYPRESVTFGGHDFVDEIWQALGGLEWKPEGPGGGGGEPLPAPKALRID